MEKISPIEKKKNIEPKFLLNKFNGLFKSNEEVAKMLSEGAQEMLTESSQDIRKEQLRLYKEFVKNILGEEIGSDPEKDPFFQVAGIPIEKAYLDKHDLIETKKDFVFTATTLVLSGDYFLDQDELFVYDDNFSGSIRTEKKLEHGNQCNFDLFDPLVINKYRDWLMQFGFSYFKESDKSSRDIGNGVIIIEPGVLDLVASSGESENISKKIQEILTWFNHDLVAHGTFLPSAHSDRTILQSTGNQKLIDIFSNSSVIKEHSFDSAFAGELWSLNFHESVFQKIVAERPSVVRYLRAHLDSYVRSVERAVKDISNKDLATDVQDYLLKVYAFGFFRLINPKDFNTRPEFADLKNKYPDLSNLGHEEDSVREFTFGEQGMVSFEKGEKKFIPHSELFAEFVDSFEHVQEFELLITNLHESLHGGTATLFPSERKKLQKLLKGFNPNNFADFVVERMAVNIKSLGDNYFSRIAFLKKHFGIAKTVLLDEKTTNKNFAQRLKKQVFGFVADKIDLSRRKQDSYRKNRKAQ